MKEESLKPGDHHYKAYVGPIDRYDFMGATQFRLLTSLGLRSHHKLLDFGCGSLRSGKLFIPYLDAGNYYGQEPNKWLIDDGIKHQLGEGIIELKKPSFCNNDDFNVGFGESFDYIVAQSIFSHTDETLARKGINALVNSLAEEGIALVTFVEGDNYSGEDEWVYPGCTSFSPRKIASILDDSSCYWKRLWWFHPAQTWFVLSKAKKCLPSVMDNFLLLGGEDVGGKQYPLQGFFGNRMFSQIKKYQILKKIALRVRS